MSTFVRRMLFIAAASTPVRPARYPVLGGLAVIVTATILVGAFGNQAPVDADVIGAAAEKQPSFGITEFPVRAQWIVSSTALVIALLFTTAVAHACIVKSLEARRRRRHVRLTVTYCALGFVLSSGFSLLDRERGCTVGWQVIRMVYSRVEPEWPFVLLNASATIPMIFFMSACSALVASSVRALRTRPVRWDTAHVLRQNNRGLRVLLYVTATAMIIGVFEIYAIYDWVAVYCEGALASQVRHYGAALAIAMGSGFSLFIACVYLPAYFVQRAESERFIETLMPHSSEEQRAIEYGRLAMSTASAQSFLRVASIVGPVAAGLFGGSITDSADRLLEHFGK